MPPVQKVVEIRYMTTIKATFKGNDKDILTRKMGIKKGITYHMMIEQTFFGLLVLKVHNYTIPYTSIKSFLANWEKVSEE